MRNRQDPIIKPFDVCFGAMTSVMTSECPCFYSSNVDDTMLINDFNLFMLQYADDAVFFAISAESLQNMLNKLHEYSALWELRVNTDKTKIMIFEKGRKTNIDIFYNNILLEVVDNFKYLGTMFYKNGIWNRTRKRLSDYGAFAFHNLNRLFQNITLSDTEMFKLFDCLVGSVLSYASKIWGFHKAPDVERLHMRFYRNILGVKNLQVFQQYTAS